MSGIKLPNGMELVFAPGCFDNFDGTQEELDSLIKEITEKFASGDALTEAQPLDVDELLEGMSDEEIEQLLADLGEDAPPRTLQ